MKCPIDQTEMERGLIADRSMNVNHKFKLQWGKSIGGLGFTLSEAQDIIAYKCPKCGKIELKVEEKGDQTSS